MATEEPRVREKEQWPQRFTQKQWANWKTLIQRMTRYWPTLKEHMQLYLNANNIPEDRKVVTFLSAIGKTNYQIIQILVMPAKPCEKSLEDIMTVMEAHFEPKPLVISERFYFNR
jgi:hypothetical protein